MQARIQLVAIIGAGALLLTVLEMVRRRRLMERYALLWLLSAVVLLTLGIWSGALAKVSHALGVIYPPNALFFIGIGFILLLLLHFSSAVSRLTDQSEMLAQRLALLDERLRGHEQSLGDSESEAPDARGSPPDDEHLHRAPDDHRAGAPADRQPVHPR